MRIQSISSNNNIRNKNDIKLLSTIMSLPSFKGDSFVRRQPSESEKAIQELNKTFKNLVDEQKQAKYKNIDEELAALEHRTKSLAALNNEYQFIIDKISTFSGSSASEDTKVLIDFIKNMKNLKNKGLRSIVGQQYDEVKNQLKNEFIIGKIAMARTSQENSVEVPNAVIFYGPTGTGKSALSKATAEQSLSFFEDIKVDNEYPEKSFAIIKKMALESKKNYEESGIKKRTIIRVDEADGIVGKGSPILKDFKEFAKDCSKKYKCTLFLTTNNPFDLDEELAAKTRLKFKVMPANRESAKEIIEHTLNNTKPVYESVDPLVDALFSNPQKIFSNRHIVDRVIGNVQANKENPSIKDYVEQIEKGFVKPSISKEKLAKFLDDEKKWIERLSKIK